MKRNTEIVNDDKFDNICKRKRGDPEASNDPTTEQGESSAGSIIEAVPVIKRELSERLLQIEIQQSYEVTSIKYPNPVTFIYNPISYALDAHSAFVRKYCTTPKTIMFLGMNPGPFGMIQTGVPFGEVQIVKDWLQIQGEIRQPDFVHPKRPILGFQCNRSEVSGQRFWGFFKELCGKPEVFFSNCYVHNYCPVSFMTQNAKNITPPEIPQPIRKTLIGICDKYLLDVINLLQVKVVVAVGRFAHNRALAAIKNGKLDNVRTGFLMHPSPINPAANKGWKNIAYQQINDIGIMNLIEPQRNTEQIIQPLIKNKMD